MIQFYPAVYIVTDIGRPYMRIERRGHEHEDVWAIVDRGYCLNREDEWEYEPQPSSRDDEFIKGTRYTLEEAKAVIIRRYANVNVMSGAR